MKCIWLLVLFFLFGVKEVRGIQPACGGPEPEIPTPTYPTNGCRLLINEIDMYTDHSDVKQFVELARYCPDIYKYSRKASMKGVKLVVIGYDGYMYGMCDLTNDLVERKIVDPGDVVKGTRPENRRYFLYVIGKGYDNINFNLKDCELVPVITGIPNLRMFMTGILYPYGLALIYSKNIKSTQNIKLDHNGIHYTKTIISASMEKTIKKHLQDFYVYGSATRYQHCDYFDRYYKYKPGKDSILRDWNALQDNDKSVSRCSSRQNREIRPMLPQRFLRTDPTPGHSNNCVNGFAFYIEDYQEELVPPFEFKYGSKLEFKCISTTTDSANKFNSITSPEMYSVNMESAQVAQQPPVIEENMEQQVMTEGITGENTVVLPHPEYVPSPVSSEEFESSLESEKPYIWNDHKCTRLSDVSRNAIENIPGRPLNIDRILNKNTCNWFEYLADVEKFRCKLCHKLLKQGIIFDRPKSSHVTDIMKEGVMNWHVDNRIKENSKYINKHEESEFHDMSLQWFSLFDSGLRGEELSNTFQYKPGPFAEYIKYTKNFVIAVQQAVRLGLPFRKFKILTELLEFFSVPIGSLYQNFSGMKAAVEIISEQMHLEFCQELIASESPVTVLLDSTTDISNVHVLAILLQTNSAEEGQQIRLYRVIKLDKGEKGIQIYKAFMKAIKKDGLEEYMKKHLHATTSDGALNVLKTFNELLNTFADQYVSPIWCSCHRYDLIYKRIVRKYPVLNNVADVINKCARIFKNSPLRQKILDDIALKHDSDKVTIKRVHAIRWVNANIRSFKIIIVKWRIIAEALKKIGAETKDKKIRKRIENLLDEITDPMFITSLCFLVDIGKIMSFISLEDQLKGTTLISKKSLRTEFKNKLEELKTQILPTVSTYLLPVSRYKPEGSDQFINVDSLETFEKNQVEFHEYLLTAPNEDNEGSRLFEKQSAYIDDMLAIVDEYFPEDVRDSFEVLNPINFPITPGREDAYGIADITRLNSEMKWGYDIVTLLDAWKTLVKGIISNVEFSSYKSKKPEEFWKYFLSKENEVGFQDMTKTIVTKALTISSSNAESERILSLYAGVKTLQRYLLQPKTVEAILRIKINADKPIDEIAAVNYARIFILKGHTRSDSMSRRKNQIDESNWEELVEIGEVHHASFSENDPDTDNDDD